MRAVVFDCDGVLVDSEPISEATWAEVLAGHGYTPDAGDFAAVRGTTSADTAAYFARRAELPPSPELVAEVDTLREAAYGQVPVFADAAKAVRALAAVGIPLAVASSSGRPLLDLKLEVSGLRRYFDVVVSAQDGTRGKPAPDLFDAAAAGLGIAASACIAVEDTELGADAAVSAGMRTVLVWRDGAVSGRHTTVSSLDPELILGWLGLL